MVDNSPETIYCLGQDNCFSASYQSLDGDSNCSFLIWYKKGEKTHKRKTTCCWNRVGSDTGVSDKSGRWSIFSLNRTVLETISAFSHEYPWTRSWKPSQRLHFVLRVQHPEGSSFFKQKGVYQANQPAVFLGLVLEGTHKTWNATSCFERIFSFCAVAEWLDGIPRCKDKILSIHGLIRCWVERNETLLIS